MSLSMDGKVALVTGGTGALGRHVVKALRDAGARVVVPWRSRRAAEELSDHLGAEMTRVSLLEADLTEEGDVSRLFQIVRNEETRLDVLCNLVGGFVWAPLEDTDARAWRRMMELNATTAFLCIRHAVPLFREAGGGRAVNVSSMPALGRGGENMSAYAASKAAVLSLTRSLAAELAEDRITVNAIVPSVIDTPANRESMPDADRSTWLDPAEIARVVRWLVSDEARIVTGAAVTLSRAGR